MTVRTRLPPGQARVVLGLLCLPEDAVHYVDVSAGLGISLGTVHTHLRRIRRRYPELYAEVMAERGRQLNARQQAVRIDRWDRSLRWGRQRYAARYRAAHGKWPWEVMQNG